MNLKPTAQNLFGTTAAALLALGACSPPHPHVHSDALLKTVSQLDCPASQDDLKLDKAATDGRSCLYSGPDGAQVNLQLIDLHGADAATALAPLTADLRSELPPRQAGQDDGDKDKVDIDLPGIHIHAHDDEGRKSTAASSTSGAGGATATASAAGEAKSEPGDEANIQIGEDQKGVVVNAGEHGAEIHVASGGSGTRLMFVLASDTPGPHGYRFVGYEARGPRAGPLAVVSVKSQSDEHDELRHAMGALLKHNVGG